MRACQLVQWSRTNGSPTFRNWAAVLHSSDNFWTTRSAQTVDDTLYIV